jgi:hypothetical protein
MVLPDEVQWCLLIVPVHGAPTPVGKYACLVKANVAVCVTLTESKEMVHRQRTFSDLSFKA